jgi:curved DNA-binding protein CbpA
VVVNVVAAMGGVDHYTLLGVRSDASTREIRRAYRRLARQHHPDLNSRPDGAQRFAELAHAYAILNHPAQRARYDQTLQQRAPTCPPVMSRVPVLQRTFRRGIIELSPGEARHLARHPLTLRDGRGRLVVLPAGAAHGDELIMLYDGGPVVLTVQLRGKT